MNVNVGNDTYTFVVYDLAGPIYNAPGVYIFSRGTPNAQVDNNPEFLYIGQTEGFRTRLNPGHEKWEEALKLGMNAIAVYVPLPSESRFDIENRLITHLRPPLNDQF
jgi:hypothetical protein